METKQEYWERINREAAEKAKRDLDAYAAREEWRKRVFGEYQKVFGKKTGRS